MIKPFAAVYALAFALSGCAAEPNPHQATSGVLNEAAAHPVWWRQAPESAQRGVYVSETDARGANLVFEYGPNNRLNKPPRCQIPGQNTVTDITSDALGNVYLPNGDIHRIYVRGPGCGHLIGSIDDPFGFPVGVAVNGSAIYVANTSANIAVCDLTGCASELTDPSLLQVQNVAVDTNGNVWASYYAQNFAISLIVWPHGAMPGRKMSGYDGTVVPGDLSFDLHNRLISLDTEFLQLHTFKCAVRSARCTKTGDVALHGRPFFGALNAANSDFQVTDPADNSIDVYAYPGFAYEYSYDRGLRAGYHPEGITQTPL